MAETGQIGEPGQVSDQACGLPAAPWRGMPAAGLLGMMMIIPGACRPDVPGGIVWEVPGD